MAHRFRDNNELLHSVRSTFMFGDEVVRKIVIVSADSIEESFWQDMQRDGDEMQGNVGGGEARKRVGIA